MVVRPVSVNGSGAATTYGLASLQTPTPFLLEFGMLSQEKQFTVGVKIPEPQLRLSKGFWGTFASNEHLLIKSGHEDRCRCIVD
jgi:hypothetical protein